MTTHNMSTAAVPGTGPQRPPDTDPVRVLPGGVPGVICQAESVEIGVGEHAADPFDATFLLAGTDQGREVAVWIRLTPTTITDLTEQLAQVLAAQHQILGVTSQHRTTDDVDVKATDEGDPGPGEGRVKQFFDPLGVRHLKDRSPRTTVILGAAIASLVILAFVLQLIRG